MSDEKREHIRLPFDAPLQLQIAGKASWIEGKCSNMSAGGILVETAAPIAIDTELQVQLKDQPEKYQAYGHVIRLVEDENSFLIAVKYKDLATH